MAARAAEPARLAAPSAPPAPRARWPWVFGAIFVLLTASSFYFATRPVPLARRMDASRSSLVRDGDGVLARVLVLGLPSGSEVRALARPPLGAAQRWRVDVEWSPKDWSGEPGARAPAPAGERLFEVRIPALVDEVEVWDRRGGLAPERMTLRLPPVESE